MVTGCGGARYDSRLAAADSLMHDHPDSALALVEAVSPASLATESDRAYRDLLLTQARYKNYETITIMDDSVISRALDYYCSHSGEQEKLTRAYLYKGAVMEELNHVDSAMFYYKHSEATANENDYNNRGQVLVRIADLYRNYADKQICYDKYGQALKYYRLTGNKKLQFACLFNMAGCSGATHIGSTEDLLSQASRLATELGDSSEYYMCQELRCRQLSYQGKSLPEAKIIALDCLNNYRRYVNNDLLLDLADIYSYSGMPDSARFYMKYVKVSAGQRNFGQIQTRKNLILSRITRLEGDTALSNHYDKIAHQVSDSIINNKQKYIIQQIEDTFNQHQDNSRLSSINRLQWLVTGISLIALMTIALLFAAHIRRNRKTKAIIRELENVKPDSHDELFRQLNAKDGIIERLLTNLVTLMKSYGGHELGNSTPSVVQQIKETIVDVADDDFWAELKSYLDKRYNGIISNIASKPNITEKDLKLIELECCGFSYLEIAMILDYSPRYVFTKRKNIANKLGLDTTLQEHLAGLKAEHEKP